MNGYGYLRVFSRSKGILGRFSPTKQAILALVVAVSVAGCGATKLAKSQQAESVVISLGEQILGVCKDSQQRAYAKAHEFEAAGQPQAATLLRQNWITPFDYKTCTIMIASYKTAKKATYDVADFLKENPNGIAPMDLLTKISDFVLAAYDILTQHGLTPDARATQYAISTKEKLFPKQ